MESQRIKPPLRPESTSKVVRVCRPRQTDLPPTQKGPAGAVSRFRAESFLVMSGQFMRTSLFESWYKSKKGLGPHCAGKERRGWWLRKKGWGSSHRSRPVCEEAYQ